MSGPRYGQVRSSDDVVNNERHWRVRDLSSSSSSSSSTLQSSLITASVTAADVSTT